MREIKFRAWSNEGLRFWYFDYTSGFNAENNDCFTHPMQFTGLKDKNGVDIYEGDIIRGGKLEQSCIVEYDIKCGRFIARSLKYQVLGHKFKHFEIVGNIHQ